MSKKIVVVIPLYKSKISFFEKKSFIQCLIVLKNYDICIVYPNSLDITFYKFHLKNASVSYSEKHFDDYYFRDINGYNNLMLSVNFYQQFIDYSFLLLYQLDAYIFKDNLKEWCNKSYAFIGAPIHDDILTIIEQKYLSDFETGIKKSISFMNGGFSLRHIQNTINLLQIKEQRIQLLLNKNWPEDMIITLLLGEDNNNLPSKCEAANFAFEAHPRDAYKTNLKQLPTGCHGWYRNDFGIHDNMFWFKHIIPVYYYKIQFLNQFQHIFMKYAKRLNRFVNYLRFSNN
ncbi:hypothetical protein IC229_08500 [Spirosoma sp. BT702]|uniref:DUF5672 domain-containing protein n=1 Tax=Spirosoma profusum TaxID=2771354 RepID=A0A926XUI6_9BACT|nr:DUF5672 family protein [Spirosoma profusum]MBD2700673.1 hypothetical protein [Spirosoma profusum]